MALRLLTFVIALLATACSSTPKPLESRRVPAPQRSEKLDRELTTVATEAASEFADIGLTTEGLSLAVIDLTDGRSGAYRGDVPYYPASVVKLCYLAYYEAAKDAHRVVDTPELSRAVKDMITVSSNDATGFVVDSITGTTSGPELAGDEWESWKTKRNAVNDWFRSRGYTRLSANQKTYCEGAYGREQAFRDDGKNRNRMTASEAARLMKEIVRGEIANRQRTDEMMALLAREIGGTKSEEDGGDLGEPEIARLVGRRLPPGSKLWSKSGDAYDVRHLVARVLLPNADLVVAAFTQGVRDELGILPRLFEKIAGRRLE